MNQQYPFQPISLTYGLSALTPYCDPDTLYLHHGQYYTRMVRELNQLVNRHRLTGLTLTDLLSQDLSLSTVQEARVKNAAGAVYNHELYFNSVQDTAAPPPLNRLVGVLMSVYGSMQTFRRLLLEAAESLPGAGWVWLAAERGGSPHIVVTENNDVVNLETDQPIFILDMWEHAYFLDNQFNKEKYLDSWFSLLDWNKAEARYEKAYATL